MDLENFELFKQGAEARLYVGDFLGQSAIAKQRFSKKYRHPDLDKQLTKDRHKAEVRAIMKCKALGVRTPVLYLADSETSTIIMENVKNCATARDFINDLMKEKRENDLEKLCSKIGSVVAKIHSNGVIHGDITTSNILVVNQHSQNGDNAHNGDNSGDVDIVMIDFGLSFGEGTPEDKGVDLYVLERAFLSTHPNTEHLFAHILSSYKTMVGKQSGEIIKKFEEIRMRGRKRTMVG